MARNCILDYAPEDTNTDTEAPNDNFNDEKIRLYNEKYIDFLVNNYKIDKERLMQSLEYEDVTIEDKHYELRENIDRITIKEDWQITANLELLMDNYNMELFIGENKRFKLKIKDLYFEVDNLVEMLDKAIPFIQKQVSEITILVLKRFGKIPKDENIDLTNTSIKDLFDIVKDDAWFLMNHDMADAFILSYYKDYPILSDNDYMDRLIPHIKYLEERKKTGHQVSDYFMSY